MLSMHNLYNQSLHTSQVLSDFLKFLKDFSK
jgi:hypothetical protein